MTWISELTSDRERSFLKTLTDFTHLGTNLDPILYYSNIYIEWKKRLIQGCVKFKKVLSEIGNFIVNCKHSWEFVNEHYLQVEGIILYQSYVAVETEFV